MIRLAVLLAGLAAGVQADELYFACDFPNGKRVEIMHTDRSATYAYGDPGVLDDLVLKRPLNQVYLLPWPGIGRTIWEEVTFENRSYFYTVFGAIERLYPEDEDAEIEVRVSGGIVVRRLDDEVARLVCLPGTVDFPWGSGLFEAKEASGQCFDRDVREWRTCE